MPADFCCCCVLAKLSVQHNYTIWRRSKRSSVCVYVYVYATRSIKHEPRICIAREQTHRWDGERWLSSTQRVCARWRCVFCGWLMRSVWTRLYMFVVRFVCARSTRSLTWWVPPPSSQSQQSVDRSQPGMEKAVNKQSEWIHCIYSKYITISMLIKYIIPLFNL